MKKLMKNKKGFTLMEMLIVVAIIVILVAISIPVFTSQLNNAQVATDEANLRAAKSIAANQYLLDGTTGSFLYAADNGNLVAAGSSVEGYGQADANKGEVIEVTIAADGTITVAFPD